ALRQAGAPKRVGVLGLGVGALAAYGEAGDTIVFYEINPEVVRLARTHFTYLADCKARESVVLGDARLSLERQPPQAFDVLAMDAFSGDAVPVHLLTREAFNIYLRHLSPSGVIAVNVTNRFVDLLPVMKAHAAHFGLHAEMFVTLRSRVWRSDDCTWVLLTRDGAVLEREAFGGWPLESIEDVTPVDWTDDYCNLFRVLKRH
ncbi:fused MFS/spermidine synthase, partial [bacterium]|nr:fused MFS/spermidine synthase [bacterium]